MSPDMSRLACPTLALMDNLTYFYVPNRNIRLLFKYFLRPVRASLLEILLRAYQEALEEEFKISVDALMHSLVALCALTVGSMLIPKVNADGFASFEPDDGSAHYDKKLRFTFGLGHTGYLRFSKENLLNQLSSVSTPWSTTTTARAL